MLLTKLFNKKEIFFFIIFLLLLSCRSNKDEKIKYIKADYFLKNIMIHASKKQNNLWTYRGENLSINNNILYGNDVYISFGNNQSLIGEKGELKENTYMKLMGNVIYEDNQYKIKCHTLIYNMRQHTIQIKGSFTLWEKGKYHILYGKNLTSDENFNKIYIEKVSRLVYEK